MSDLENKLIGEILQFPRRLGRIEYIAFCPTPSMDKRHEYLTEAPNRAGGVWVCETCYEVKNNE